MKLQDAHAAEVGAVGTWQMIGYIAPGAKDQSNAKKYSTTVFDYEDKFSGTGTTGTTMVGDLANNTEGWRATAKTALNDCKIASYWNITMSKAGSGASVKYVAAITDLGNNSDNSNCKSLTANFGNIGHE